MTIAETTIRDKWGGIGRGEWVLVAIILLSSSLCFGLGLIAGKKNAPKGADSSMWIEQLPAVEHPGTATGATAGVSDSSATPASKPVSSAVTTKTLPPQPAAAVAAISGAYVASKTGTKYYLPSCGTVSRIKDENKVWFATKADAEKAGYQPSSSCKGL